MAAEDTTTTQLSFDKVFEAQIPAGAEVNDYPSPAEEFGFHSGEATGSTSETADNLASLAAIKGTQWNDSNQIDQVKELDGTTKATVGAKVPETITLASASYSAGEAGSTTKTKAVNVTLTPSISLQAPAFIIMTFTRWWERLPVLFTIVRHTELQ